MTQYWLFAKSICLIAFTLFAVLSCIAQAAPSSPLSPQLQQQQQQSIPQIRNVQDFESMIPATPEELQAKMELLQRQFAEIKRQLATSSAFLAAQQQQSLNDQTLPLISDILKPQQLESDAHQQFRRQISWQPMRRMVAWQPMKRSLQDYSRENVIRAIEDQLAEILQAGQRLGINAEDILEHLRRRNASPIFKV